MCFSVHRCRLEILSSEQNISDKMIGVRLKKRYSNDSNQDGLTRFNNQPPPPTPPAPAPQSRSFIC
ncbi:hypothetical protein DERF_011802 [Dermatophagoides farinae]|uniref:Uncharacterized protein n=1 Tax=Dermatophagoides farinae TaxID=6954 RepID=A0A922L016_DERFA|nr:hypothetical protein DERF_011802 [Dermatophagoides farinae]